MKNEIIILYVYKFTEVRYNRVFYNAIFFISYDFYDI